MTTASLEGEPPTDDSDGIARGAMTRLALVRDGSDKGLPFKRWKLAIDEGRRLAQSAISGSLEKSGDLNVLGSQGTTEAPTPDSFVGAELFIEPVVEESARL